MIVDKNTNHILTASGKRFWPLEPTVEDINIFDISHALSNLCRFTGHCREFYSVAEHSVRVAWSLPEEHQLWGLLHDASEAYINDLCRPLKEWAGYAAAYLEAEEVLMAVIAEKFGLEWPMPDEVKVADKVLLVTEQRDLMPKTDRKWFDLEPLDYTIYTWSPRSANMYFLRAFKVLTS